MDHSIPLVALTISFLLFVLVMFIKHEDARKMAAAIVIASTVAFLLVWGLHSKFTQGTGKLAAVKPLPRDGRGQYSIPAGTPELSQYGIK